MEFGFATQQLSAKLGGVNDSYCVGCVNYNTKPFCGAPLLLSWGRYQRFFWSTLMVHCDIFHASKGSDVIFFFFMNGASISLTMIRLRQGPLIVPSSRESKSKSTRPLIPPQWMEM